MTAPEHKRSAGEVIATVALGALAAAAAACSLAVSPFFVMATDSCGPDDCNLTNLTLAYVLTWGGVAAGALIGVVGVVVAWRRNRRAWVWPAAALAVVVVGFALGALLAMSVTAG